ncbi:MAG: hypothetical protein ABJF01_01255 [bacterium]
MHAIRIAARGTIALLVIAGACSKSKGAGDTASAAGAMAPDTTAPAAVAATPPAAPGIVLTVAMPGAPGAATVLTDANGRAVYILDRAPTDANSWTPLAAQATAAVGDTMIKASMIGTGAGANGVQQATYNGNPLYYYTEDQATNDRKGQGKKASGATGHLVMPDGNPAKGKSD